MRGKNKQTKTTSSFAGAVAPAGRSTQTIKSQKRMRWTAAVMAVMSVALIGLGIGSATLKAWGPTRDTYTFAQPAPHDKVVFNSITDNPDFGDERNFFRTRALCPVATKDEASYDASKPTCTTNPDKLKGYPTEWADYQPIINGYIYEARIFVHNDSGVPTTGDSNDGLPAHGKIATGTRLVMNMPNASNVYGKQFEINGYIHADNMEVTRDGNTVTDQDGNPQRTIWDNIAIFSAGPDGKADNFEFHTKILSQHYYNNVKTEKDGGFALGNDLFSTDIAKGALVGYNQMDGNFPGCFQFSGYALIQFVPEYRTYDVEKTVNKTTANIGDAVNYTIKVTNTSGADLNNVVVKDKLPTDMKVNSTLGIEPNNGVTGDINSLFTDDGVKIASIPAGGSVTLTYQAVVRREDDGGTYQCGENNLTNTVTSSADQTKGESNPDNNSSTVTVTKDCTPGYDVEKTVDNTTANPGDTLTYTITATNTGKVDLTNLKINDQLPAYYSKVTVNSSVPVGSNVSGSFETGSVTIDKLPVGQTATFTISYTLRDKTGFACGETTITNNVTSSSDQSNETNLNNNSAMTTVTRTCIPGFDVEKTVDKTTANPGDTLIYTITARNTGETPLANVQVRDTLPAYYESATESASAPVTSKVTGSFQGDGYVTIDKLNPGESAVITVTYKLKAAAGFACGQTTVTNTASGINNEMQPESNTANNDVATTVTRNCTTGYDVEKTVDKSVANPGDTLIYTITARNTGNTDLTNVKLVDTLPDYATKASEEFTLPQGSLVSGSIVNGGAATIDKLPAGQTASVVITYQLKPTSSFVCGTTTIANKVTSTTDQDQTEDSNSNNQASTDITRQCASKFDLAKTVDKTKVGQGEPLKYTLTFRNTGEQALTNVIIKDSLPKNVTPATALTINPSTGVTGTIDDLFKDGIVIAKVEAGQTVTITFGAATSNDATVYQCGDNSLTNTASVTTSEVKDEVDKTNNSATSVLTRVCASVPPETPKQPTPEPTPTPTPGAPAAGIAETKSVVISLAGMVMLAVATALAIFVHKQSKAGKR